MRTIITLALFLIVGFVGSRGLVSRATHRLPLTGLFATGMEYFLLGILFGPRGLHLITRDVLVDLEPIVYLSLGWVGLLFGIEMSWTQMRKVSRLVYRLLLVDVAAFVVVFSSAAFFVIGWAWPALSPSERLLSAFLFGITAAVSSPTVIAVVAQRLPARGPATNAVKVAGALSALFPLIAFGFLFVDVAGMGALGQGALWWLFVNAVGLVLGFLMVLFTWGRTSDNEMLLLIVGTVLLIGGLCYLLQLSSLYIAMIMGFVVGNFSRKRDQVFRELHHIEKTMFVVFLVIVGAMVDFGRYTTVGVVTAAYVALRLLMKYAVTGTAAATCPDLREHGRRMGLAFSGQGVLAMAIALDFSLATRHSALSPTLTVVALAVLVNDVAGYAITRRVLRSTGEVVATRAGRGRGQ
jgi:Kef-type K+ transport system membrane component KefB